MKIISKDIPQAHNYHKCASQTSHCMPNTWWNNMFLGSVGGTTDTPTWFISSLQHHLALEMGINIKNKKQELI